MSDLTDIVVKALGQLGPVGAGVAALLAIVGWPLGKNTVNAMRQRGQGDQAAHSSLEASHKRLEAENAALRAEIAELEAERRKLDREGAKGLILEDKVERLQNALLQVMHMFEAVSRRGGAITPADTTMVRAAIEIVLPPSQTRGPDTPLRGAVGLPGPDETPQGPRPAPAPPVNAEEL